MENDLRAMKLIMYDMPNAFIETNEGQSPYLLR